MTVDFADLRGRIQRSIEELGSASGGKTVEAALRARARQVASLRLDAKPRHPVADVVVVKRVESTFAFPVAQVLEVRDVRLGMLPRRSRHICGLFQLHGHIHCLVDIRPFVGETTELEHQARTLAILLQGRQGPLGVRVDEVVGSRTLYSDELDTGRRERRLEFVSHVTRDRVEVIDVNMLFASAQFHMTSASSTPAAINEGKE